MLLKSKHVLKNTRFYTDNLCRKKSLLPEVSFSACICLYIQELKWEVLLLEVLTVQHPNYFMGAWMADPGWVFLDGQGMRSACVEVVLNSSCQTDFMCFVTVCASRCNWAPVHWSQVENRNSSTPAKKCARDYLLTYAAKPWHEAGSALKTEKNGRFQICCFQSKFNLLECNHKNQKSTQSSLCLSLCTFKISSFFH